LKAKNYFKLRFDITYILETLYSKVSVLQNKVAQFSGTLHFDFWLLMY